MESLPPVHLGATILASFAVVLLGRRPAERDYVLGQPGIDRPRRQFGLDFMLCLVAGGLASAYNIFAHGFPLGSALNLFSGVMVVGFFISLDLALARGRIVILDAVERGAAGYTLPRLWPMSRSFLLVAVAAVLCLALVLVMIVVRDVGWVAQVGPTLHAVRAAERAVTYEILFVMAVLLALLLNVIVSYSRNLDLLLRNQTRVLERVARGDLSRKVPVASADEFGAIAAYTNTMIDGLKHRVELLGALRVAEDVQQGLLPKAPPDAPGFRIAAASVYSDQTGGDYYDFLVLPDGRLGVAVGDVSGHGVAAALLMTTARAFLRMAAEHSATPEEAVDEVNQHLAPDVAENGAFLTLFYLVVDTDRRTLAWVRGGHDPALLYDPVSGDFVELDGKGPALGVSETIRYVRNERRGWTPGSIVAVGTDGVWETRDPSGGMFGKERLKEIIRREAASGPRAILDHLYAELEAFRGAARADDDVTLVLIQLN